MRRKKLLDERGTSVVEFAIAVTIFLLLVFGGIEFSRAVWQYNIVANAAKAAARWTVVRGSSSGGTPATTTQIHDYIVTQMYGYSELDTVTWLNGTKGRGDTVLVVVRSSYDIRGPRVPLFTLPLRSAARMIIAR